MHAAGRPARAAREGRQVRPPRGHRKADRPRLCGRPAHPQGGDRRESEERHLLRAPLESPVRDGEEAADRRRARELDLRRGRLLASAQAGVSELSLVGGHAARRKCVHRRRLSCSRRDPVLRRRDHRGRRVLGGSEAGHELPVRPSDGRLAQVCQRRRRQAVYGARRGHALHLQRAALRHRGNHPEQPRLLKEALPGIA